MRLIVTLGKASEDLGVTEASKGVANTRRHPFHLLGAKFFWVKSGGEKSVWVRELS